jgi:hypothetical protein
MYALYLYFLGLSFRNTSKAEPFREKGVMLLYGIGYSDLIPRLSTQEREE